MNKVKIFILLFFLATGNLLTQAGEIIQITESTRNLVPRGKGTDAIDGDWIMKNDKVILVIGNAVMHREANMRVQSIQGTVIDFTSLADNNDYLAAFYPQGYPAGDSRRNPALFANKIEVIKGKGTEITLRATRNTTDKIQYESVTEYTLRDGESFVRVKTTYSNPGQQNVFFSFADKLRMDMDIKDEVPPLGKTKLAFMYNKWFNAAYAVYSETGLKITEKPRTDSDPGTGLLVGFQDAKSNDTAYVTLEPGQRIESSRYLLYGKDVAEIQRIVNTIEKTNATLTTLKIIDTNKKPVPGAFIDVLTSANERASFAITNAQGIAEIPLSPGAYKFKAFKIGHDSIGGDFSAAGKAMIVGTMAPLTSINISLKEKGSTRMIPVKVEFKGIHGTPDPYLGSTKRAEGAANLYYAIKNSFTVPITPGHYLVTISHGPEYGIVTKEIEIKVGETKTLDAEIGRLFSSPDWVIADFHNHSSLSGDNDAETRSRIINLAGAGIEFGPATEHNRISSYTKDIKRLGLEGYLASAPGIELTGATGLASGPNHQNSFPLRFQEGKQGGGFPGIKGDAYEQLKGIFEYDNKGQVKLIQHNHPGTDIPLLYFDKNRDGIIDNGYNTRQFTDMIEIQTYIYDILNVTSDDAKTKKAPIFYWLQMLNQGDRIFGTMTSDSHLIGERGGLKFVYAYTKKDNPLNIDADDIATNAKKGRMVMSNGPFLKADINGYLPGDDIKKTSAGLKMNVEVYGNEEVVIERVQVLVDGHQDKSLNFTKDSHPQLFKSGGLQFKNTFPINVDKDANVIVVATGKKKALDPRLTNKASMAIPPIAVTNPFFVDANGDGFVPSKDTLGEPLPTAVRTASNR
jgi:hypothetical protein